ncbi:MAG: SDR family oxidoreductase [Opitutales bacterium]|nr:SDR family oxidoreductase [Opitutales bacterium]
MNKPSAIVTGASSGIGKAVADRLLALGYHVTALARWSDGLPPPGEGLHPVMIDLANQGGIRAVIEPLLRDLPEGLDALVNAAGFGRFDPHRSIDPDAIAAMTAVNLTAPMILSRLCLPALEEKQGKILNIASVTARHLGKRGAAYAGAKAGLLHFGRNLFEEVRKSGVSVCTLLPDLTDTPFYDTLDFAPTAGADTALGVDFVANAAEHILTAPPGSVIEEITLRPQRLRIEKCSSKLRRPAPTAE